MLAELEKPITYLKGVGPKRAELYQKLGIGSVYELLNHFPRYYTDYTSAQEIRSCPINEICTVRGRIVKKLPPALIEKGSCGL